MCTYCGKIIRESSTGSKPFKVLPQPFEWLALWRGVWWMRAQGQGGECWRRCYWWTTYYEDISVVRVKQCLRCGEEEKVLDRAHTECLLA